MTLGSRKGTPILGQGLLVLWDPGRAFRLLAEGSGFQKEPAP